MTLYLLVSLLDTLASLPLRDSHLWERDFIAIAAQYVEAYSERSLLSQAYSERSLLSRVQWLRELLDHTAIDHIAWVDTRDMHSLTKGRVPRELIHELMAGTCCLRHPLYLWS